MLSILKSQAMGWGPHAGTEHFQIRALKKSVYVWPNLVTQKNRGSAAFFRQKGKCVGVTIFC